MFVSSTKSRYRDSYSFRTWQDQHSILKSIDDYEDSSTTVSFDNPCHIDGVYFSGIEMLGKLFYLNAL